MEAIIVVQKLRMANDVNSSSISCIPDDCDFGCCVNGLCAAYFTECTSSLAGLGVAIGLLAFVALLPLPPFVHTVEPSPLVAMRARAVGSEVEPVAVEQDPSVPTKSPENRKISEQEAAAKNDAMLNSTMNAFRKASDEGPNSLSSLGDGPGLMQGEVGNQPLPNVAVIQVSTSVVPADMDQDPIMSKVMYASEEPILEPHSAQGRGYPHEVPAVPHTEPGGNQRTIANYP